MKEKIDISANITFTDLDNEYWEGEVLIKGEIVEARMNTDTIAVQYKQFPFKTFSTQHTTGHILSDMITASLKYAVWLSTQKLAHEDDYLL